MPAFKSVGLAWLEGFLAIATIALPGNTLSLALLLGPADDAAPAYVPPGKELAGPYVLLPQPPRP